MRFTNIEKEIPWNRCRWPFSSPSKWHLLHTWCWHLSRENYSMSRVTMLTFQPSSFFFDIGISGNNPLCNHTCFINHWLPCHLQFYTGGPRRVSLISGVIRTRGPLRVSPISGVIWRTLVAVCHYISFATVISGIWLVYGPEGSRRHWIQLHDQCHECQMQGQWNTLMLGCRC